MQIHELTQPRLNEGITNTIGNVVSKGVSAVKGAAASYSSGRQDRKVGAIADKAYRTWKNYEAQLLKADPDARQNGDYEKQLLAFVNKNLLGGMYLPNVINKDKIIALVQQISATQPTATQGAAGAFGQMTTQLGQGPAVGTQTATGTGGTATTTAGGKVNTANPNNPNLKATVPEASVPRLQTAKTPTNEAVDPTQELFKQLVQQAALAQTTAPGTGGAGSSTPSATATATGNNPQSSARGMAQALKQQLTPALVSGLPTVGATAAKLSGDTQVTSTGNPAADGLLILMGFQGL